MRTCSYKPIKKKKKKKMHSKESLVFFFFFAITYYPTEIPHIPQEAPQNYMHEMSLSDIIIS